MSHQQLTQIKEILKDHVGKENQISAGDIGPQIGVYEDPTHTKARKLILDFISTIVDNLDLEQINIKDDISKNIEAIILSIKIKCKSTKGMIKKYNKKINKIKKRIKKLGSKKEKDNFLVFALNHKINLIKSKDIQEIKTERNKHAHMLMIMKNVRAIINSQCFDELKIVERIIEEEAIEDNINYDFSMSHGFTRGF